MRAHTHTHNEIHTYTHAYIHIEYKGATNAVGGSNSQRLLEDQL